MPVLRRVLLVAVVTALLVSAAFAAGYAVKSRPGDATATDTSSQPTFEPTPRPTTEPTPPSTPPATPSATPSTAGSTTDTPTPTRTPTAKPAPVLAPGPRILGPGDDGDDVRDLQARLKQISWFNTDVTGVYGDVTTEAVRGFQAKREIPVTGEVDRRTLDRLEAMTTQPTDAELHNRGNQPGALDARCRTGRVLCVDKSSSTLRWVVDGTVLQTLDVRFGASTTPTREGLFHVYLKDADHVSRLYGSSMPLSMFFSGGQAVHYSSDFAAVGYSGASHGCVNVRDYDGLAQLFSQVRVGDTVVVYWS